MGGRGDRTERAAAGEERVPHRGGGRVGTTRVDHDGVQADQRTPSRRGAGWAFLPDPGGGRRPLPCVALYGSRLILRGATEPAITFASDYGHSDEFVGVVHLVLHAAAPRIAVIDLCHMIPRQDVVAGSRLLLRSLPWLASGVLLAVVDPGVGGPRRPVAVTPSNRPDLVFVGPDNGLLWPVLEASGGPSHVVVISAAEPLPGGPTFDGRDVFAPAAASLANGTPLEELGEPASKDSLLRLEPPRLEVHDGGLSCEVTWIDVFGNAALSAAPNQLPDPSRTQRVLARIEGQDRWLRLEVVRSFGDLGPGELGVLEDSTGHLAIVANKGSAADKLGARAGALVNLAWEP